MPRALSLFLPAWPIDLVRRRARRVGSAPPEPLLLTADVAQRRLVACRCERSAKAGVRPGMDLAHARALLPTEGVCVLPHRPDRDAAALESLALWATRFSPLVSPDPPDGLFLDISGCERVFRGEERLLHGLLQAVGGLGFAARAAVAPTFGCAWAVARFGGARGAIVPEGRAREALAPLPTAALRLSEGALAALAEVGVECVEHVLALPRRDLPARFGPELLLRIDQALGDALELIRPVRPTEPARAERQFDGPTTQYEAVEITAHELLGPLCTELARRESGARCLEVLLARVDAPPERLTISLSRPSRSVGHLWGLIRPRLERVNLGFGVEFIALTALRAARLRHEQAGALGGGGGRVDEVPTDRALAELTDVLANRLGPERLARALLVESHVPERGMGLRPMHHPSGTAIGEARAGRGRPAHGPEAHATSGARVIIPDRPSVLLEHPEPAAAIAITPDGPPSVLRWRGREHRVAAAIGPERINCEWWRSPGPPRDYFKVQDGTGRWLWVYRSLDSNHWFVHGEWG